MQSRVSGNIYTTHTIPEKRDTPHHTPTHQPFPCGSSMGLPPIQYHTSKKKTVNDTRTTLKTPQFFVFLAQLLPEILP